MSSLIFFVIAVRFLSGEVENKLIPVNSVDPSAVAVLDHDFSSFTKEHACPEFPLCLINPDADSYANVLSFDKADACLTYSYLCPMVFDLNVFSGWSPHHQHPQQQLTQTAVMYQVY